MNSTAEHQRTSGAQREQWQRWGTYVGSRSWGTIRETDPVHKDKAWSAFPFEHACSRAYRWTEDGIAGFSDDQQRLCFALAFWNEHDPMLKERFFGLGNEQGNHGEDVKEYFFYLDGLPSYSYMKMLYKYPQAEFPYTTLVRENALRGQDEPAFELIDALPNTFAENRYFDILIEYAKGDTDDILCRVTVSNRGEDPAPLHVLPHLWFRNTWSESDGSTRPQLRAEADAVRVEHPDLGTLWWYVEASHEFLFTENETNTALLFDQPSPSPYTKDGIDYAVVRGQRDHVNPNQQGTKCAAHCVVTIPPGEHVVIRTRLRSSTSASPFADFDAIFDQRLREADEFYTALHPDDLTGEQRIIQRSAFAGLNWNKNFYHFNVEQWLKNAPKTRDIDHNRWRHFDAHDVLSIPDPWEYPYLATWDVLFQIVTLCIIDPEFAKRQMLLLLSDRYMRHDGALPAFEGDLTTPHPPIQAWTTWDLYNIAPRDRAFLQAAYERLQRNYGWWMKTQQREPCLFTGGFLGVDNISLLDRNREVPEGAWLAQADATGWMAFYALHMLAIAVELGHDADAARYLTDFIGIRKALAQLWHEEDRFFYDVLVKPDGTRDPLRVRSAVGLVPLVATILLDPATVELLPRLKAALESRRSDDPDLTPGRDDCYLLAAVSREQLPHLLAAALDSDEFRSKYGLRSLSKHHKRHPAVYELDGKRFDLQYEPGDSMDRMFGGNSNWRGPVWAPLNQLLTTALYQYHDYYGEPMPLPNGKTVHLEHAARDLVRRLVSLFERDADGWHPYYGDVAYFQTDPHWRDYIWFYEHFHGDTGEGLGASHQNGWTAMIARMLHNQGRGSFIPKPSS